MNGLYSVYSNCKWLYYQGFPSEKAQPSKSNLTGQYAQGSAMVKQNNVIQELGLTPEEAAVVLPGMTIKIGEGMRPMGTIANGPSLFSTLGKVTVGAGAATLLYYLLKPKEKEEERETL